MQVTNYHAYLRGHAFGKGPSKGKLKLRVVRESRCPKKNVEALNTLSRIEGVGTKAPHLKGEEIFGSTKRKLDIPIGDVGDSHRPKQSQFFSTSCLHKVYKGFKRIIGRQWTME